MTRAFRSSRRGQPGAPTKRPAGEPCGVATGELPADRHQRQAESAPGTPERETIPDREVAPGDYPRRGCQDGRLSQTGTPGQETIPEGDAA